MTAATHVEDFICAVKAVGSRVDWLTLAFRVRFRPNVLRHFVTTDAERPPANAPFAVRAYLCKKYRLASCTLDLAAGEGRPATRGQDPTEIEEHAVFRMKMTGEGKTLLENGSCRVVLHENAPRGPNDDPNEPGWTLAVEWSGVTLIDTDYREAVHQSFRIAMALGDVLDVRLRRLDLCADIAGLQIPMDDREGWCTRPQLRSRKMRAAKRCPIPVKERAARAQHGRRLLKRFEEGAIDYDALIDAFPDIDDTYYFPEGNVTGWKFGKGVISARVYDKQAELRMRIARAGKAADRRKAAGDKKEQEEAWWRLHGWDGQARVARVEVQCRGEVLHELDARCDTRYGATKDAPAVTPDWVDFADKVGEQLDRVWTYFAGSRYDVGARPPPPVDFETGKCTKCKVKHKTDDGCRYTAAPKSGWLRQIVLEGDRPRSECDPTSAWRIVQRVVFKNQCMTIPRRTDKRSAVRATQVLGCALALLGYVEKLHPTTHPDTGEVIDSDEDQHAKRWGQPEEVRGDFSPEERKRREALAQEAAAERVRDRVFLELDVLFRQAGAEVAKTLNWIYEHEPHEALGLYWVRKNAARARWKPLAKTRGVGGPANDNEATG